MFTRLFQDIAISRPGSHQDHELLRALLDSIVDYGIAVLDANGACTFWSTTAKDLTGYEPDYVIGKQFSDIFTDDQPDADISWLSLQDALESGRVETEAACPSGNSPNNRIKLVVTPIYDSRGNAHGFVVVMHEFTGQDPTITRDAGKLSFELMVNSVEDYAIFMLDPDGCILSWNLGAERLKGYKADEVIGQDISMFYTETDRQRGRAQKNLEIAARTGRFEGEGWRIRKDGSRFWASVIITSLRDKSGYLRGYGKVTRDLTRHYHSIIEPLQSGMLLLCPEGTTFACNDSACRLLDLPEDRIFGRRFAELKLNALHENGSAFAAHELPTYITLSTGEACHDVVVGIQNRDGMTNWISMDTDVLDADKNGRPTAIAVSMHDISALKRSNDVIRRGEQLFRSLVTASAQIVWEADADGAFRNVSASFESLTGKSADDAKGWSWLTALPASDQVHVGKAWQAARSRGEMFEVECRLCLKDKTTRYFLIRGVPLKTDDGQVREWIGTMSDIDVRKRHEQELVRKANCDELTGLANRNVLTDRIQQAISHAERAEELIAVLFVDLDNFKEINDQLGHQHGDKLLQVVANRLAENVRSGDTVSRIGGDEFVILLTQLSDPENILCVHRKLQKALAEPIALNDRLVRVSMSIGVALSPMDGTTVTDLLRHADLAMYHVKQQGRNGIAFYQADMDIAGAAKQSGKP